MIVLASDVTVTHTDDGGAMVLHEPSGRLFHLNPSGCLALSALCEGGVEAAVARLSEVYDITTDTARSDAATLLTALTECGLVKRR